VVISQAFNAVASFRGRVTRRGLDLLLNKEETHQPLRFQRQYEDRGNGVLLQVTCGRDTQRRDS